MGDFTTAKTSGPPLNQGSVGNDLRSKIRELRQKNSYTLGGVVAWGGWGDRPLRGARRGKAGPGPARLLFQAASFEAAALSSFCLPSSCGSSSQPPLLPSSLPTLCSPLTAPRPLAEPRLCFWPRLFPCALFGPSPVPGSPPLSLGPLRRALSSPVDRCGAIQQTSSHFGPKRNRWS